MPANVPAYQDFPAEAVRRIRDRTVQEAFSEFFKRLDDWEERVALFLNNNVLVRLLAAGIAVPGGSGSVTVTFATAQPDTAYVIAIATSWVTAWGITAQSKTQFTATFGTAAPTGGGTFGWALFR